MIDDSVLSVVILDGFRPNIIFEFGYLIATKKPIILLQSTIARINIKSFYSSIEETGLEDDVYSQLKNPYIQVGKHLSDFAGKHVAYFNLELEDTDIFSLESKLEDELLKAKNQVVEEFKRITVQSIDGSFLSEFMSIMDQIYRYYFDPNLRNFQGFLAVYDDLQKNCNSKVATIPYKVSDLIGTIFIILGERNNDINIKIASYRKAIEVFTDLLQLRMVKENIELQIIPYKKSGDAYLKLFDISLLEKELDNAIKCYNSSLKYNHDNDLGFIVNLKIAHRYFNLALNKNIEKKFKKSIEYNEYAISFINSQSHPSYLPIVKNNLGNVHLQLGNHYQHKNIKLKETINNWKQAIECYSLSLSFFNNDEFLFANTLLNMASCHSHLALKNHEVEHNTELALDFFGKSIKIFTVTKYPEKYGVIKYNIGNVFVFKYSKSNDSSDRVQGIDNLRESVIYLKNDSQLADAYTKLGELYVPLDNDNLLLDDFENSINAYNKALDHSNTKDDYDIGILWYWKGLVYHKWFYFDSDKKHLADMKDSLDKAETFLPKNKYPEVHFDIERLRNDLKK